MLQEDLEVGDKVTSKFWEKAHTVVAIEHNIVYIDREIECASGEKELDCFIMRFDDPEGVVYNRYVEKVK